MLMQIVGVCVLGIVLSIIMGLISFLIPVLGNAAAVLFIISFVGAFVFWLIDVAFFLLD